MQGTKEIITQRRTLEETEKKTRLTFATNFLLLNPHSLQQILGRT